MYRDQSSRFTRAQAAFGCPTCSTSIRRTPHASRRTHIAGAPDIVWEIISPDSEERDWRDKLPEYEQAGIREYWIINPYVETAYLYVRDAQGSYQRAPETDGVLRSTVIPDFWLRTAWLWQQPLPGVLASLREMGVLNG